MSRKQRGPRAIWAWVSGQDVIDTSPTKSVMCRAVAACGYDPKLEVVKYVRAEGKCTGER